jgi:TM2 domain-containing membrane protein YozV
MWFLAPHLKQILKKSLLCWAICFLVASVIGIYSLVKEGQISSFLFLKSPREQQNVFPIRQ